MEAMNKILEDGARRHNSKILYGYVNVLRGSNQFEPIPVKDTNRATLVIKKQLKIDMQNILRVC